MNHLHFIIITLLRMQPTRQRHVGFQLVVLFRVFKVECCWRVNTTRTIKNVDDIEKSNYNVTCSSYVEPAVFGETVAIACVEFCKTFHTIFLVKSNNFCHHNLHHLEVYRLTYAAAAATYISRCLGDRVVGILSNGYLHNRSSR